MNSDIFYFSIISAALLLSGIGLWAAYAVLLVCSPFIGGFTYIMPASLYQRGSLYPLLLLPLVAILLLTLAGAIR